jgi:hypothetical protein
LRYASHALHFRLAQALSYGDAAMTQTIIGVFDTLQDAELARTRLEAEGVAHADIRVHANDEGSTGYATSGGTAVGQSTGEVHEGAVTRIEHFFKNLFGEGDRPEEIGHLPGSSATRRCAVVGGRGE